MKGITTVLALTGALQLPLAEQINHPYWSGQHVFRSILTIHATHFDKSERKYQMLIYIWRLCFREEELCQMLRLSKTTNTSCLKVCGLLLLLKWNCTAGNGHFHIRFVKRSSYLCWLSFCSDFILCLSGMDCYIYNQSGHLKR